MNKEKGIRPYKQKGMTCAISCMLMVLEYYKIIDKANKLYERKYYHDYHSKYMEGTPFSAVASHLAKQGLKVELCHLEKELFTNDKKTLSDYVFEESLKEYINYLDLAKKRGATIKVGEKIDCDFLKEKLDEDNLIILAGEYENYLHAILLTGYNEDNNFIVCDPLYKEKQIRTSKEIEEFMDTPIGKWCIVVREK